MHLKNTSNSHILVVDDDLMARQVLKEYLKLEGYQVTEAVNGEQAFNILTKSPNTFDVVLLDIQMPILNGLEVLKKIKENNYLHHIPVIMQTGVSEQKSILEGFKLGAFHYLIKPINIELISTVISSAISNSDLYCDLKQEIYQHNSAINLLGDGVFYFQTLKQAHALARLLAKTCSNPEKVVIGLAELLSNAIEHGNLGISYTEKGELIKEGLFDKEIERRLELKGNASKKASVRLQQLEQGQFMIIKDEGQGFNWRQYCNIDLSRIADNHGRGIMIAQTLSFSSLKFIEPGNEVHVFSSRKS